MKLILLAAAFLFNSMTPVSVDGFEITPPKGWEKKTVTYEGMEIIVLMSPLKDSNDTFQENVNVVTEKVHGMGFKEYVDLNVVNMEKMLQGFTHETIEEVTINGLAFKRMKYNHQSNGLTLECEVFIGIKDDMAYVITCTAPKGGFADYASAFEDAVGSFKVTP